MAIPRRATLAMDRSICLYPFLSHLLCRLAVGLFMAVRDRLCCVSSKRLAIQQEVSQLRLASVHGL
jgi:hypothetical protein